MRERKRIFGRFYLLLEFLKHILLWIILLLVWMWMCLCFPFSWPVYILPSNLDVLKLS